ncbi:NUDIX hydrolase [Corallococcus exiguus]|uniref:NUDIX hydrolase n=1 Tax=Corallococcus exiguus TaxID=83462 RepID=UPI001A904876|nr:NUDIX hydrolase [Corallococcus exiguus]MBN8466727.1 NUDIX hydrolase [Corallococcus exiguus]
MHAYLAIQRVGKDVSELLLAQKNIYLPPHGRYQFAAVARNAVQYVIPGGRVQPGETPLQAAVREFQEDSGLTLPVATVKPLFTDGQEFAFFRVVNPPGLSVEQLNVQLAEGRTGSLKFSNLRWVSLEDAPSVFGNKDAYKTLPWVSVQVMRALNAGFSKEWINQRANEPHARFVKAVAHLILDTPVVEPAPGPSSQSGTPAPHA